MSSVLPTKQSELLEYLALHATTWNSAPPTAIGLTAAQITTLNGLLEAAQSKYDEVQALRERVKAATLDSNEAMSELRSFGSMLIRNIRNYAETTNNTNVYVLAEIPAPKNPASIQPPGKPIEFTVGLNSDGSLTLKWRSENSGPTSGGYFEVKRRLAGQAAFTIIGGGSTREFIDGTMPAGTTLASYIVTPRRGTHIGTPSDQFNVQFGVGSAGPTVTGYSENAVGKPRLVA